MLRGSFLNCAECLSSVFASFMLSTECIMYKLGTSVSNDLHLLDCRCPMKCHSTSFGSYFFSKTSSCKVMLPSELCLLVLVPVVNISAYGCKWNELIT